jgi:hypothetical protein
VCARARPDLQRYKAGKFSPRVEGVQGDQHHPPHRLRPGGNVIKLFLSVICGFSFAPGKPFQPSVMFVGEGKSLSLSGAPESYFNPIGFSLTCKHCTRLERFARDKHSSLLRKYVKYGCKFFIILCSGGNVIKLLKSVFYECS